MSMTVTTRPVPTRRRGGRRSAFTLIELLLVLVILGVLAAIVVPKVTGRGEDARKAAAKTTVRNIDGALDLFENDNGKYPTNEEGLKSLLEAPGDAKNWKGPYLKNSSLKDPWDQDFVYRYPGQYNKNGPDVLSTGPDKKEGGGDDIDNWSSSQ